MLNGIVVINEKTGRLLYSRKFATNFGFPDRTDAMQLSGVLFALCANAREISVGLGSVSPAQSEELTSVEWQRQQMLLRRHSRSSVLMAIFACPEHKGDGKTDEILTEIILYITNSIFSWFTEFFASQLDEGKEPTRVASFTPILMERLAEMTRYVIERAIMSRIEGGNPIWLVASSKAHHLFLAADSDGTSSGNGLAAVARDDEDETALTAVSGANDRASVTSRRTEQKKRQRKRNLTFGAKIKKKWWKRQRSGADEPAHRWESRDQCILLSFLPDRSPPKGVIDEISSIIIDAGQLIRAASTMRTQRHRDLVRSIQMRYSDRSDGASGSTIDVNIFRTGDNAVVLFATPVTTKVLPSVRHGVTAISLWLAFAAAASLDLHKFALSPSEGGKSTSEGAGSR